MTNAQGLAGSWKGVLEVGGMKLNLVFHVNTDNSVLMDSPDQGAMDIPTTVSCLTEDSVNVSLPQLAAQYSGKLRGNVLYGTFTQNGYSFPLNLERGEVKLSRPQTPQPPFNYTTEEVKINNDGINPKTKKPYKAGGAVLSGTLTYPENFKKGMPVVVMITGSGPQNRDEEIMGHKPFLVIADYLARHGIATLRYDDRGVGESTGDFSASDTYDFMRDAAMAIAYLRDTRKFGKIGVLGHSEGGTIAYMLAARKKADFLVSLAGPVLPGDTILLRQNRDLMMKQGYSQAQVDNYCRGLWKVLNYKTSYYKIEHPQNGEKPKGVVSKLSDEKIFLLLMMGIDIPDAMRKNLFAVMQQKSRWLDHWLLYNPAKDVRKVECPVMVLGGSNDLQVRSSSNLKAARNLFFSSDNKFDKTDAVEKSLRASVIKEYPGLNHLFQPSATGLPQDYGKIETTISEEVLRDISDWINKVAK